jgi:hypothetical protein
MKFLVHVHTASVNAADWHLMRGTLFLACSVNGFQKPKNTKLGADGAGRADAIGRNVTQFQAGDDVSGDTPFHELGSLAEYVCVHEDALALKLARMTVEHAAARRNAPPGKPVSVICAVRHVAGPSFPQHVPPFVTHAPGNTLARHRSCDLVPWFCDYGVMPLSTPISGSWLTLAAPVHRIRVPCALAGQQVINRVEHTVVGWSQHPTSCVCSGSFLLNAMRQTQAPHFSLSF